MEICQPPLASGQGSLEVLRAAGIPCRDLEQTLVTDEGTTGVQGLLVCRPCVPCAGSEFCWEVVIRPLLQKVAGLLRPRASSGYSHNGLPTSRRGCPSRPHCPHGRQLPGHMRRGNAGAQPARADGARGCSMQQALGIRAQLTLVLSAHWLDSRTGGRSVCLVLVLGDRGLRFPSCYGHLRARLCHPYHRLGGCPPFLSDSVGDTAKM